MRSVRVGLFGALALGLAACNASADGEATSGAGSTTEAGAKTNPEHPGDEAPPMVNTEEPDATVCGAGKLDRWLGEELTDAVRAEIREAVGHDRIRFIAPGDMVTMDFRPDRLNAETGTDNRIKLFRCG